MPTIDYTGLGLVETISTLLFIAAIDTGFAWVMSFVSGTFNPSYALDFLRSHVLKIAAPITGLALFGHGIPQIGVPAIPISALAATAALAVYALVTLASLRETVQDKAAVPPEKLKAAA